MILTIRCPCKQNNFHPKPIIRNYIFCSPTLPNVHHGHSAANKEVLSQSIKNENNHYPIFCFWCLVTFGNKNTKILRILCLHFARQDGQDGKKGKENHATKVTKIPKDKNM